MDHATVRTLFFLVIQVILYRPVIASLCQSSHVKPLPNEELRYVYHKIEPADTALHDAYLQEGWYSTSRTMPLSPPSNINMCGTKFPIWLNGTEPTTDTPVNGVACTVTLISSCDTPVSIQVAKCDGFNLYYLKPTGSISVGYCFGIGQDGERPAFNPPKPAVGTGIYEEPGPLYKTKITCQFEMSEIENLFYMVHWYENGLLRYNTPYADSVDSSDLMVTEHDYAGNKFNIGNEISCSVTAFLKKDGPPSRRSDTSDDFFVGIKILTPSLSFLADEKDEAKRTIRLQPTVPIGCQLTPNCTLQLTTYLPINPIKGECQGLGFDHISSACGILIYSATYNKELKIVVQSIDPGQEISDQDEQYEVNVRIEDTRENILWKKYSLPSIPVTVRSTNRAVGLEPCSARNDPHYTTFDRRQFDDHSVGTKILYQNVEYNTEVQISSEKCWSNSNWHCVCGIAVRAGYDVVIESVCDNQREFGYRYCGGESRSLTVKQISDIHFQIHFQYGTYVDIRRYSYGRYLTAYIYPTNSDKDNTRGLCGKLDLNRDNDFHNIDGTSMGTDYHNRHPSRFNAYNQPLDFIKKWRVKHDSEDLFHRKFDDGNLVSSTFKYCICENSTVDEGATKPSIPCKTNGAAICKQGDLLPAKHCNDILGHRRRRRSLQRKPIVPAVTVGNIISDKRRIKRDVSELAWTEEDAQVYCTDTFKDNEAYTMCSQQLQHVDTDSSIDVCKTDIEITNGTDWVQDSIDSMISRCTEELVRNVTWVRAAATGDPLPDSIRDVACFSNCSGHGHCQKGVCVCEEGRGASDCSIDMTVAVTLSGLLNNGLCDPTEEDCSTIYVFGGAFVKSDMLLCKLQEFTEDESGQRMYGSEHTAAAYFSTYIEVECRLGAQKRRRSADVKNATFVTGYSVTVTNNGLAYSDRHDFFLYDSECQIGENVEDTFRIVLMDGFCFIENKCVTDGQVSTEDTCNICNSKESTRHWSQNSFRPECHVVDGDVQPSKEDDVDTVPVIVGAVVGGLVLATIAVVSGVFIVKRNNLKKSRVSLTGTQ